MIEQPSDKDDSFSNTLTQKVGIQGFITKSRHGETRQ